MDTYDQLRNIYAYYRENQDDKGLKMHFHNQCEVIFVLEGEVRIALGGVVNVAKADCLVILSSLEHHEILPGKGPYKRFVALVPTEVALMSIREPQLLAFLMRRREGADSIYELPPQSARAVRAYMAALVDECRDQPPMWQYRCDMLLGEMLLTVFRAHGTDGGFSAANREVELVTRVVRYIAKHFASELTLEALAKEHLVDKYYLSRVFKQVTGYGFKEYLILYRLSEAKRLLLSANDSVSEICFLVGYVNINHFIKSFRLREGVSPLKYRKLYKEARDAKA